jgi:hypothetical protein
MQRLWWTLLVLEICLLVHAVVQRRGFQRRGTPVPWHIAGTMSTGIGAILLIICFLVGLDHPLAMAALSGSVACLAVGIGQTIVAARRPA